jgi:ADP-ribose pyrophosphatase YjhB (NUDIX family)
MTHIYFEDRYISIAAPDEMDGKSSYAIVFHYTGRKELLNLIKLFEHSVNITSMLVWHENQKALWKSLRSCFRIIKAGGGLVINSKGEYLFIRRRGFWDLPKGKLEKFENYEKTAIREVCEECDLKNPILGKRIATTFHTYRMKGKIILKKTVWFEMHVSDNENPKPQASEDITEIRWFKKNDWTEVEKNTFSSIKELLASL